MVSRSIQIGQLAEGGSPRPEAMQTLRTLAWQAQLSQRAARLQWAAEAGGHCATSPRWVGEAGATLLQDQRQRHERANTASGSTSEGILKVSPALCCDLLSAVTA